jgi:hypothetical protein
MKGIPSAINVLLGPAATPWRTAARLERRGGAQARCCRNVAAPRLGRAPDPTSQGTLGEGPRDRHGFRSPALLKPSHSRTWRGQSMSE